jgi:hypothetical protein
MKKLIIALCIGALAVAVYSVFWMPIGSEGDSAPGMSEGEARAIAERTCIKGGESLAVGTFNPNSRTWWFDANLNATRSGCNPSCVVYEATGSAEINWRCTGLIVPTNE